MVDEALAGAIERALSERKSSHLEAQVDAHRTAIDRLTERNAEHTREITTNFGRMRDERDCLDIAKAAAENDNFAEHLTQEWAKLRAHPRLASAALDGDTLTLVTTDDIRLHSEDRTDSRWLGAFRIVLGLSDGSIMLHNLNTRHGGRDHPHVVNGNPCFGGDHQAFAQLLSNGDLFVLFEVTLQYLETLNPRDEYGRYGAYWFEQEDERPPEQTIELEVAA